MIQRHSVPAAVLFCLAHLLAAPLATLAGGPAYSVAVGPVIEADVDDEVPQALAAPEEVEAPSSVEAPSLVEVEAEVAEKAPVWAAQEEVEAPSSVEAPSVDEETALGSSLAADSSVAASDPSGVEEEDEIVMATLPSELEAQIARTSEVAVHVAKEVNSLSRELSHLQRSLGPTMRRHQQRAQPAVLLNLRSNTGRNRGEDLDSSLYLDDNSTDVNANITGQATADVKKDFKYFFSLGNKITIGWAIVYWVGVVLVFVALLCMCGCIGFRRT